MKNQIVRILLDLDCTMPLISLSIVIKYQEAEFTQSIPIELEGFEELIETNIGYSYLYILNLESGTQLELRVDIDSYSNDECNHHALAVNA
jgi:hypothetical protein